MFFWTTLKYFKKSRILEISMKESQVAPSPGIVLEEGIDRS
jgi:hypothetical protein